MKTQREIETAVRDAIRRFEQEYMGREPKDTHAFVIGDGGLDTKIILTPFSPYLFRASLVRYERFSGQASAVRREAAGPANPARRSWEFMPLKIQFADRVEFLRQSGIRRYSALCAELGGVNLSQGVCDQPAPDEVKAAAIAAIREDQAAYTNLRGIIQLRQAIAEKMKTFNGIAADPESEVTVTVGTAGAFACLAMSALNPGDEVIIFSPYYSYHVNLLKLIDAKVRFVDLRPPHWEFDSRELERAFGPQTRMILINTPANPTGKVFSLDELQIIAHLCEARNVLIATDEIYEYITYGAPHVSIGRLPEAQDRTVTISGASKTYAVTGWRIGYAVGPADIIEKMALINDQYYICAPAPLQHAIVAGLNLPDSYYRQMQADYLLKRDMLADTLRGVGFDPFVPEGSYYMLASFGDAPYENDEDATMKILHQVGVAAVPGSAFYRHPADGLRQLRFCYAKQMSDLEEACRRLKKLGRIRKS